MASLSQALRLGDLPPPHRTFQGHATHIREWSMMLRPNDSWRVGRIRARYLTARLPNPPVRPVRETFASYGSRARDIMGKVHFASSTEPSPWTALPVRWVPLYCFPTLPLRPFAMYVAFLRSDYYGLFDFPMWPRSFVGLSLTYFPPSFILTIRRPPISTHFPYATLFRSCCRMPLPRFVASQYP